MRPLRILIVTHAPISPKFGAAQMAINLADAFRKQEYDVTLWSPHPLTSPTKWWEKIQPLWQVQKIRAKLEKFLSTQEPFDIIDIPGGAGLVTKSVSKSAPVIVSRSIQPAILYIVNSLKYPKNISFKEIVRCFIDYFYSLFLLFLVLQDWRRAKFILCLGSLEFEWMKRWFPWWKGKLIYYVNALSKTEQDALAKIRLYRQKPSEESIRFLWIGRWVSHKGTSNLLDFIHKWLALRPQDTFTIAGCGMEAEKDCPVELLESGSIKIIHWFERSQLFPLLLNHDIGLFTSKVEGWGLVLNEMLESGLIVFATPVGGVPDLQPFFQDTLKPFPKTLGLISDILINPKNLEEYYNIFSWDTVATNYIKSIGNYDI